MGLPGRLHHLVLILLVVPLLADATWMYRELERIDQDNQEVVRGRAMATDARRLGDLLRDAESAELATMLAGKAPASDPSPAAEAERILAGLAERARGAPADQRRLAELRAAVEAGLARIAEPPLLEGDGHHGQAIAALLAAVDPRAPDGYRQRIAACVDAQEGELAQLRARRDRGLAWLAAAVVGLVLAILGLGGLVSLLARRAAMLQQRVADTLRDANARMESRVQERTADLQATAERLRLAVTGSGIGTWHWNLLTGEVARSDSYLALIGRPAELGAVSPGLFLDIIHPDDRAAVAAALARARDQQSDFDVEYRVIWPDGGVHWLAWRGRSYRDESGRPVRMEGIAQDVTARKHAEQAQRDREEQLRAFVRECPFAVAMFDTAMRYVMVSDSWRSDFGLVGRELTGVSHYELFPDLPQRWLEIHRRCLAGATESSEEDSFPRADGTIHWLRWLMRPWRGLDGTIGGAIVFSEFITARKSAELALRESEARLSMAISAAQLGSFQLIDGRLDISPRYREIFALPPGDPAADRALSQRRVHPDDVARVQQGREDVLTRGVPVALEFRILLDDGAVRWLASWGMPRFDAAGTLVGMVGLVQDISVRKQDEELRAGENRLLEMVAKGEPLGAILEALCRSIEQRTWGLRVSVLLLSADGLHLDHGASPSLPEAFTSAIDGSAIGPSAGSCGTAAYTGREVVVGDIANDPLWAGYRALALPHGLRACWSTPIIDNQQRVLGTFAVYADRPRLPTAAELAAIASATHLAGIAIARTRAEQALQELNQGLERRVAERTALLKVANQELESFSFSVSHDLRAPLRSIDGFSLALIEEYQDRLDDTGRDYLRRVRGATTRMGELIDDLLTLARVSRLDMAKSTVDLSASAEGVAAELRRSHPERALEFRIAPGMTALCDERLMRIVLENLLGNAVKFTGRKAQARIVFDCRERGGVREYSIADNGAGFDMTYAGKLFGAFQRLHAMTDFPGTGIGLATVMRIISRHGGTVRAEGELGQGATISFTLG